MLTKDRTKIIKEFESLAAAAKYVNRDSSNISKVCRGLQKIAYGYVFEYA